MEMNNSNLLQEFKDEALSLAHHSEALSRQMQPVALGTADELYLDLVREHLPIQSVSTKDVQRYRPSVWVQSAAA